MAEFGEGKTRGIITVEGEGKKRPSLYVRATNKVSKVATFGSKEDMETFDMYLHFLLEGKTPNV